LAGSPPHSGGVVLFHEPPDGGFHLAPLHLAAAAVEREAGSPHALRVPRVARLVAEAWPEQHRHAGADALQRRVPAAVRPERGGRRVRQDLLLRRPADHRAAAARRGVEAVGEGGGGGGAADEARAEHPEERVSAVGDAPRRLDELAGAHAGDAAEADVEHRRRRLGV
ncbi:Os07g0241050, partial [Oryza sativa Japonica Group]